MTARDQARLELVRRVANALPTPGDADCPPPTSFVRAYLGAMIVDREEAARCVALAVRRGLLEPEDVARLHRRPLVPPPSPPAETVDREVALEPPGSSGAA